MSDSTDRRIHAASGEWQIVRYDRAGKWYVEYDPPRMRPAKHIGVRHAAALAVQWEQESAGHIHIGVPGGRTFDRAVEKYRQAAGTDNGGIEEAAVSEPFTKERSWGER